MPVDHLGAVTWCSSALIQSGHNWFESNGISFLGELLYTGNNQEVWQFYFSTLQATVYDITAFFSNYMGGLIYVGAKDMTDPMHVNTVNDTRPSKYAGDHIQALQSQLYPSRLQMAMVVS